MRSRSSTSANVVGSTTPTRFLRRSFAIARSWSHRITLGFVTSGGFHQSIVIGGLAVSVWGEPRFTKDADLKVLLQREDAGRLLAALPPEYRLLSSEREKLLQQLGLARSYRDGRVPRKWNPPVLLLEITGFLHVFYTC